jgi:hypothetical protein
VSPSFVVLRGDAPIVLVAPHGGRRDPVARPWGSAPLKMNDLHTGAVTRELAARLGASAVINESSDRNDVDLNRISAAHDAAPEFLAALAGLIEDGLARHETIGLLTVHGWNVVQPAVDLGLGVHPSAEALAGRRRRRFRTVCDRRPGDARRTPERIRHRADARASLSRARPGEPGSALHRAPRRRSTRAGPTAGAGGAARECRPARALAPAAHAGLLARCVRHGVCRGVR